MNLWKKLLTCPWADLTVNEWTIHVALFETHATAVSVGKHHLLLQEPANRPPSLLFFTFAHCHPLSALRL